ncbi:MAG: hypothetical protein WKF79_08100 [Nocardioides sp.]
MTELWWLLPAVVVLGLSVYVGHRALMSADRTGAGMADAFGAGLDVFDPARGRAQRELDDHHTAGPVTPTPDELDELDDEPVQLLKHPDGSPRSIHLRRPR